MAKWIIDHMPPHTTYLEPFFGSGAVLFNKPRGPLETVNDLDGDVVNLFRMIREHPEKLANLVRWTPYSREEYYNSYQTNGGGELDSMERARRFLVRCWMAIGAKTSDRTGWKNVRRAIDPHPPEQWKDVPRKILVAAERLELVQIENQPAVQVIQRYNLREVLIYCDPPYILSTRNNRMYRHEMTEADHLELLEVLDVHPGPVLLSGYAHPMYNERLRHWHRETRIVQAEQGKPRTEVLWINPVAADRIKQRQMSLF